MTIDKRTIDLARDRYAIEDLVGRSVKLTKKGKDFYACCPFHRESKPSFVVVPEKGFWHCYGCGESGDAIKWVMKTANLSFRDAVKWLVGASGDEEIDVEAIEKKVAADRAERERKQAEQERRAREQARQIWRETVPLEGTVGETYMVESRGIPPEIVRAIPTARFHPRLYHGALGPHDDPQAYRPGIVCARTRWPERTVNSIWRIFLEPDGSNKLQLPPDQEHGAKMGLGVLPGAAIRLTPMKGRVLLAGEGFETCASIMTALPDYPVWAVCSVGGFKGLVIPDEVEVFVACGDNDGEGRPATRQLESATKEIASQGIDVVRIYAPGGFKDFNDAHRSHAGLEQIRSHLVSAIRSILSALD